MPLPTPNDKEKKSDFVSRCLSSEMIRKDFKTQDQRMAVCYNQYEKAKDKSKASIEFGDDEMLIVESSKHYNKEEEESSQKERDYDHEMTISQKAMEELHNNGETYITETDGDRKMVIKVNYKK